VLTQSAVWPDRIRPLRRIDYESLVAHGLFDDARVELLVGALVEVSPQGPRHADVVRRLGERLIRALPEGYQVRTHSPLALSDDSEPEPDLAVVPEGDYRSKHPTHAVLVIEVADSSLQKDRGIKTALYATAGIAEFWLVSLPESIVEVHRHPSAGRYSDVERIDARGQLAPAAFPTVRVPAAEILS
jgi:Uma2 family endonuclease